VIAMPKAKPDQVIVHRIELQEKERDMIEAYVGGTVVKNAVVPVSIAAGVGSAAYIGYKAAKAAFGWTEDLVEDIKNTPIGYAAQATAATDGATLPPGIRGFYKLVSWATSPMR